VEYSLLSQLPSSSLALEKARLAICTARLGRMHGNEALLRKSLNLYGEGLQELQKALYDPRLMYKDETLGACMCLSSYELMECPAGTPSAYSLHHHGCARLIQLRGAKAHTSGLGHELFVTFRTQAIMNSLEDHRSTYLSEKAWKTLPWKTTAKKSYDQLLDIVALAPDIFRRTDDFDSMDPRQRLLEAIIVIEECWKVDARLRHFYQSLEESTPGPLYWPALSQEISLPKTSPTNAAQGKLFPVSYHFPSLPIARTLIFYWSVLNMLWTGMVRLYQLVSETQAAGITTLEANLLPPLGHRADFMTPARNTLQSVEYLMQDKMLGLGPQSVIAPLSIVAETIKDFPECAREVRWAFGILDEIRERGMMILGCTHRRERFK
jgi:Fungal specific transcription factor domain